MEYTFMPFFGDDNRAKLLWFLKFYRTIISELLETGRDVNGRLLFIKELYPLIKGAWKELDNHFSVATTLLMNVPDDRLLMYGLYGAQLDLKISIVTRATEMFRTQGGKSFLRRLLDAIDNLLGSILSAIGAGDALAEVKDCVKDSIDD